MAETPPKTAPKTTPGGDNAVILHHPDAVETEREKLMGRHAAGAGFLKGFVDHSGVAEFYCQVLEPAHAEDFARRVQGFGGKGRPCSMVTPDGLAGATSALAPTASAASITRFHPIPPWTASPIC
jgi:hypothetical protein